MLLDFEEIKSRCNITGIIHVGAYAAEERKIYGDIPVIWVEADPELAEALVKKGLKVYNFAAIDHRGTVRFNRMKFRPANSIFEPNLNAKRRSDVYIEDKLLVPAGMLKDIQRPGFNTLIMDIQGAELLALKGADLAQIDHIICEVHKEPTYKGIPMVEEIDGYLKNFTRVGTSWTKHGWGDALYIKNDAEGRVVYTL